MTRNRQGSIWLLFLGTFLPVVLLLLSLLSLVVLPSVFALAIGSGAIPYAWGIAGVLFLLALYFFVRGKMIERSSR